MDESVERTVIRAVLASIGVTVDVVLVRAPLLQGRGAGWG